MAEVSLIFLFLLFLLLTVYQKTGRCPPFLWF